MAALDLPFQHRILLIEDDNVSWFVASEILSRLNITQNQRGRRVQ